MGEYQKTDGNGDVVKVWIDEAEEIDEAKRLFMGMDVGTEPPGIAVSDGRTVFIVDAGHHRDIGLRVAAAMAALGSLATAGAEVIGRFGNGLREIGPVPVEVSPFAHSEGRKRSHWAGGRPSTAGAYKGSKAAKKASRPRSRRRRSRKARK